MSGFLQGRLVPAALPYAASHAMGGGLPPTIEMRLVTLCGIIPPGSSAQLSKGGTKW
ncbi:MAG: hypothetical protein JOZ19_11170 [Rubrobacter sp.]|nr:hypothetical protein [Rubrobacter sp.]